MSGDAFPAGKLPAALLGRMLARFGPPPPEVRLGPALGEDAAAIDVSEGTLVAATDPITLTASEIGRYAVVINANDVAVMGVRPRWFLAVVLLPEGTTAADVEALFASMQSAAEAGGVSLVGGHTEITPAVRQAVVVGQMLGLAETGRVVTTAGAEPGDAVVQIGPVPVEGASIFALQAAEALGELDPSVLAAAQAAADEPGISVVEPALECAAHGATSLHDPTEGGLASGLHEVAAAAGVRIQVDADQILWFGPGLAVCRALGADPWATLASGALLAAFPPGLVAGAVEALGSQGYPVAVIGEVTEGRGVEASDGTPIASPERDEVARLL